MKYRSEAEADYANRHHVAPVQSDVAPFIECPTCDGGCERCKRSLVSIRDLTYRELLAHGQLTPADVLAETMARLDLTDDETDVIRYVDEDTARMLTEELRTVIEAA
jgi:hypothetical protein